MNQILQKRIEETAHQYIQSDAVAPENMQLAFGDFINGANFALQNQWISVDEALPKKIEDKNYSKYVLARQKYYDNEYYVIARYDYGFDMWVSTHYFKPEFITHWMEIPSLEGVEE